MESVRLFRWKINVGAKAVVLFMGSFILFYHASGDAAFSSSLHLY